MATQWLLRGQALVNVWAHIIIAWPHIIRFKIYFISGLYGPRNIINVCLNSQDLTDSSREWQKNSGVLLMRQHIKHQPYIETTSAVSNVMTPVGGKPVG